MENEQHNHVPDDCFSMEALEVFQSFEGQILTEANYYLWVNTIEEGAIPYRFLYFLELIFDNQLALILTSGEDSDGIRITNAENLVETARNLQNLNKRISIQRLHANAQNIWAGVIGKKLHSINLTPNEEGYYLNDGLMLDFLTKQIVVQLSLKDGLEVVDWAE